MGEVGFDGQGCEYWRGYFLYCEVEYLGWGVWWNFVHEKDFLKSRLELNIHCDLPEKLGKVLFLEKEIPQVFSHSEKRLPQVFLEKDFMKCFHMKWKSFCCMEVLLAHKMT